MLVYNLEEPVGLQDLGARGQGRCVPAPALAGAVTSWSGTGSVKPKAHLFYGRCAVEAPIILLVSIIHPKLFNRDF
jgi:hypothetical protein